MSEPDVASDYDDRGVQAAHAVLVEIGLVLGAHRDAIVVIGGSVPSLLLPGAKPSHIGSLDIDLNLNTEKLAEHGYADLVEKLEKAGYQRNVEGLKPFQLKRVVNLDDGGEPIAVIVDLLMPKGAKTQKHRPQHVEGLRVQEIDGGDVALKSNLKMMIAGTMPDKRQYKAEGGLRPWPCNARHSWVIRSCTRATRISLCILRRKTASDPKQSAASLRSRRRLVT